MPTRVIVCRHGDRFDFAHPFLWYMMLCNRLDTPLTAQGEEKAKKLGQLFCKKYDIRKKNLLVESSCHERCMSTARNLVPNVKVMPLDAWTDQESVSMYITQICPSLCGTLEYQRTDIRNKVWKRLLEIQRNKSNNVLIVTHGVMLFAAYDFFNGKDTSRSSTLSRALRSEILPHYLDFFVVNVHEDGRSSFIEPLPIRLAPFAIK